jgi:hypothetical protein
MDEGTGAVESTSFGRSDFRLRNIRLSFDATSGDHVSSNMTPESPGVALVLDARTRRAPVAVPVRLHRAPAAAHQGARAGVAA